jgi:DNA-binding Lrp family transcriptional regulator
MRRAKLDKIDKKILRDLQSDGRITNVELAKNVGISAPPCLRRVRALEEAGYIQSYHAHLNPASLGYNVTVFAMVKLTSHAESALLKFEKMVADWPLVRECYMLAGEVDFMLKVVARDWDSYQNFLTHDLTSLDNVISVKSSLAIRTAKADPGVPIED